MYKTKRLWDVVRPAMRQYSKAWEAGSQEAGRSPITHVYGLLMQEEHTAPRLTYHCIGVNPSLSLSLESGKGLSPLSQHGLQPFPRHLKHGCHANLVQLRLKSLPLSCSKLTKSPSRIAEHCHLS